MQKYREYFNIDPEYFPAVNQQIIATHPEVWKKFYPHETFIKLIKDTINVLERKYRSCLWVEGAYGTGKSHAVLTLKKLLDASESDTHAYFKEYNLSEDLYNSLEAAKSNGGKVLTVHRSGSSSIHNDNNLVFAIQESIEQAFNEAGIENKGKNALKDATIAWLKDEDNKYFFNKLITGKYRDLFSGDDADAVINKLETYTGEALSAIMDKISAVAEGHQINPMKLSTTALADWIRDVIKANNLKAIVFIWDEFSEFFKNNSKHLTGFQELCEISETDPFYFIIVTHETQAMFSDKDPDYRKLNDRFVNPHAKLELPDNIAFQLMGTALKKSDDPMKAQEWGEFKADLINRTQGSRKVVSNTKYKITADEMSNILPIHPYAALLLKYIANLFDSNQRSMFDFIQNDRGDEIKGFQWYIDNYGPYDDNPLLTVDMLWDFFYDKGKENLTYEVRSILDYYPRIERKLDSDQKRVLKAVLLLQVISNNAGDAVDLFIPNEKNLDLAFEGTDLENHANSCARQLVSSNILFEKDNGDGKKQFAPYSNDANLDTKKQEEIIEKKPTSSLILEELPDGSAVKDAITLEGALKLRYDLNYATTTDFDVRLKNIKNTQYINKIPAIICFAKNDKESYEIESKINTALQSGECDAIFIDATCTPLGKDGFETYRHYMAISMAQTGKDNVQANQNAKIAKEALKKWKDNISSGEFIIYSSSKPSGERAANMDALLELLENINKSKFSECLEGQYTVIANMYTANALKQGVECACYQETKGTFRSASPATKLENALSDAWHEESYWVKTPNIYISKLKIKVDGIIDAAFKNSGRISIRDIYEELKKAPYGFMPCNLTAFILGFLLKEYTTGTYGWSDGTVSDEFNVNKLKEMVDEVIHLDITPNNRYRDKYIVAVTPEEKAFRHLSSIAFSLDPERCTSVEETRALICEQMKHLYFPIWTIKSVLPTTETKSPKEVIRQLIDLYCKIANSGNSGQSPSDIAQQIGSLSIKYTDAAQDLKSLFTTETCTKGMASYLQTYKEGELVSLANEITDNGKYISCVHDKFDADAANWVWLEETAQQKIDEVILEYQIITASNKVDSHNTTYRETINDWLDKCNHIKISFSAGKDYFGALTPFLEILCEMAKTGFLPDSKRNDFLEKLTPNIERFRSFYNESINQVETFKSVCHFYLDGLSDEDCQKIFTELPNGLFIYNKPEYMNSVEAVVSRYKSNQKSTQLKELWRSKTNTASPYEWSKIHQMPILCIVPDDERSKASRAFGAINAQNPDSSSVDYAMEYLNSATFFSIINDDAALDEKFKTNVIKNNAVMLTDIKEVKGYLSTHISSDPYYWASESALVDKCLTQFAESKYNKDGYKRALEKIDNMDAADVKGYLKNLIKDNMNVGIEIIKDN